MNVHTMAHARRYFDLGMDMRAGSGVHDRPANTLTDTVVNAINSAAHREETAL